MSDWKGSGAVSYWASFLELARLVNAMRGGPPATVPEARGLDPASQPHDSVEAMAAHYLREVRAAQPAGLYAPAEFSFDDLVAYEMAACWLRITRTLNSSA